MFDPIPNCNQSANIKDLNAFISRVEYYAEQYEIDCSNHFSFILSACTALSNLLKQHGKNVWPKGSDEPITEFQDIFQLLIYGLGDNGLLFHSSGCWQGRIHHDPNDEILLAWSSSECTYKKLAYAMIGQHESYLKVKALRADLKSHANQANTYGNKSSTSNPGFDTNTSIVACALLAPLYQICPKPSRMKREEMIPVVQNLFKDHLFTQYAPLYLYYALSSSNPTQYNAGDFLTSLNCHAKKPDLANQPQRRKEVREKCLFYHEIEATIQSKFPSLSTTQVGFEPHRILFLIQKRLNQDFGIKETVKITKASLSFYSHSRPQISIDIKVGGTPVIDIMKAFYVVWKNQSYNLLRKGTQKPRNLEKSLRLLYQSDIVSPIDGISPEACN